MLVSLIPIFKATGFLLLTLQTLSLRVKNMALILFQCFYSSVQF